MQYPSVGFTADYNTVQYKWELYVLWITNHNLEGEMRMSELDGKRNAEKRVSSLHLKPFRELVQYIDWQLQSICYYSKKFLIAGG